MKWIWIQSLVNSHEMSSTQNKIHENTKWPFKCDVLTRERQTQSYQLLLKMLYDTTQLDFGPN